MTSLTPTTKKKVNRAFCYECYQKHWTAPGEIDGQKIVIYHSSPSTSRICEDCGEKARGRNLILFCKPEDTWWNRRINHA